MHLLNVSHVLQSIQCVHAVNPRTHPWCCRTTVLSATPHSPPRTSTSRPTGPSQHPTPPSALQESKWSCHSRPRHRRREVTSWERGQGERAGGSEPLASVNSYAVSLDRGEFRINLKLCSSGCRNDSRAPHLATYQFRCADNDTLPPSTNFKLSCRTTISYSATGASVDYTCKQYTSTPEVAVGTAAFPDGLDTSGCGPNTALR